jgi:hypothetical protein
VPKSIKQDKHYVSAEVQFALALKGQATMNWTAIIEAETLAVLYPPRLCGQRQWHGVSRRPHDQQRGPLPNANTAALNPIRTSVVLQGLVAPVAGTQNLVGNKVRMINAELPNIAPPTEPSAADFVFNARTNDFAAVNAYYHCDRFFRLMESMGFTLAGFFGAGTAFPNAVDHRGWEAPPRPQAISSTPIAWVPPAAGNSSDHFRTRQHRRCGQPHRNRLRLPRGPA